MKRIEADDFAEQLTLARQLIIEMQSVSISLIQRHLLVGFTRAQQLLAALEGDLISVPDSKGIRTLLVSRS